MRPRRCKTSTNFDVFLDFPVTKTHLAEILGVARSTLCKWENIAFWRLAAFRYAYPKKHDGTCDRYTPLSPYQSWVLGRVGRLMAQLRNSTRVKLYVLNNQNDFSRYTFEKAQKQVQQKLGA